jgi:hypothetical protein
LARAAISVAQPIDTLTVLRVEVLECPRAGELRPVFRQLDRARDARRRRERSPGLNRKNSNIDV